MGGNRWLVSELPQGRFQRKQVQLFIVEPWHQALECDIRCSPTRKCAYANRLLSERLIMNACFLLAAVSFARFAMPKRIATRIQELVPVAHSWSATDVFAVGVIFT